MLGNKSVPKVVSFLKSANYYYQKGNYYYQQNKLDKALLFFKKTVEVEPENSINYYNLACLLSRMGYLDKANEIFSSVVYQMDPSLTECYFLMAVNYGLTGNLEKACYYLNLYLRYTPDGEMAQDAEELLFALKEEAEEANFSKGPGEKEIAAREKLPEEEEVIQRYHENPAVQNALWQALYGVNEQIVNKAIRIFSLLPERSGEIILREFVRNPWVKQRLRLHALLEMKNMGVRGRVTVFMEECLRDIDLSYYPLIAPRWLDKWQEVLDCTLKNMRLSKAYSERFYEDVQAMWIDYLNNIYPRVPNIKKSTTWAAALEYAIAKFHFLNVTQKKLAQQYNISPSSVSVKYREINRVLNIEHRAYQNMLRYLAQREDE
ncbi:MAG: tetratricopeptide repeat protein [Dethiobacteria bacterium]